MVMMSSCLQQHWQEYTHSSRFSPWLTLEQRAHSWRRTTRAEKNKTKKMLKNMMQASLTYWVMLCVCMSEYAAHFTILIRLAKNAQLQVFCFSPGHTLAEQWHLLCGCRKVFLFFLTATVEYCLREGVHMKQQSEYDQIRVSGTCIS